jgi:hypothetical protein
MHYFMGLEMSQGTNESSLGKGSTQWGDSKEISYA